MKCPACDTNLVLAERQGIEIDYCPQCRGVWLDRGELDKLIERAAPEPKRKKGYDDDDDRDDDRHSHHTSGGGQVFGKYDDDYAKRHKKKSLLGELFDF
jgi:uncharacterized protein